MKHTLTDSECREIAEASIWEFMTGLDAMWAHEAHISGTIDAKSLAAVNDVWERAIEEHGMIRARIYLEWERRDRDETLRTR